MRTLIYVLLFSSLGLAIIGLIWNVVTYKRLKRMVGKD